MIWHQCGVFFCIRNSKRYNLITILEFWLFVALLLVLHTLTLLCINDFLGVVGRLV